MRTIYKYDLMLGFGRAVGAVPLLVLPGDIK